MNLFRAFATVGGMTMISRVLGFIRDIFMAAVLGTGPVADAFFVAFRFPNLFRRLFAEGAFNAAFVPLFTKELESEGKSKARQFAEEALSVLLTTLLILTAIAELSMPWLMYLLAPGFSENPEKFDLAVLLTRIAFPYLLCMSLVALLSGILNSLGKFAVAAAAPILLNIVLISVLAAASYWNLANTPQAGIWLSWGVAAAGALQLITLIYASRRQGFSLSFHRPRLTPGVKRLIKLGIPGVIAGGITQLNIMIGTIIASMQESAVSYLYFADRIYQLPLGIVGIAIGVVLLPDLSRRLRQDDHQSANDSLNRSLEFSLLLTLPAAIALFVVPVPIIQVLFERGVFDASDTSATAAALAAFAWGLPAFVLIKVFSPGFFAREDTKTPTIIAGISILINIAMSLSLFWVLGHVGIAIATSIAGWVNAGLLGVLLWRRGHFNADAELRSHILPIILSSVTMGVILWLIDSQLSGWFAPASGLMLQTIGLALLVGTGLVAFAAAAHLTGAAPIPRLLRQLKRR